MGTDTGVEEVLFLDAVAPERRKPAAIDLHVADVVGPVAVPIDGVRPTGGLDSRNRFQQRDGQAVPRGCLIETCGMTEAWSKHSQNE